MATAKKQSRTNRPSKRQPRRSPKERASDKTRKPAKQLVVEAPSQAELAKGYAQVTLTPTVGAAGIASRFSPHGRVEGYHKEPDVIAAMAAELREQCREVLGGDLKRAEVMLISQAHSLDVLFTNLALTAHACMGTHLDAADRYMRLALRAQGQCRATLETLATIKNPPVVFAKQANIAHGHQQVNNGEGIPVARAAEPTNQPNKLLEASHGNAEWVDTGATREAAPGDSPMAAVGEGNRA